MSRIGKMPVKFSDKVKVSLSGQEVRVEGPKGKLTVKIPHPSIKVEIGKGELTVSRPDSSRRSRSLHGLTRAILANGVKGVSDGFERTLSVRGVGYRAELKGKEIHFALGYSHPIVFPLPEGVTAEIAKQARTEDQLPTIDLTLRSVDRALLGEVAVKMRSLRKPEPYKGKGVKYLSERVRRKEGKTGTA